MHTPSNPNVLLVDDDVDLRGTLSLLLTDAGFSVWSAADGPEAVSRLRERQFDVVVTGWGEPATDKPDLVSQLRGQRPDGPIIVISNEVRAPLDELDVDGFLRKPFRLVELLETLEAALNSDSSVSSTPQ